MKSEVNPIIGVVVVVIILAVVGVFLWRGTGGGSSAKPMSVGNAGPFAPGGVANNKGGAPVAGPPGGRPPGQPGGQPGQPAPSGR